MPSLAERRLIDFFTFGYNRTHEPKIISLLADDQQEAPDAICTLANGKVVALELTTVGAPKGTQARRSPHKNPNLSPLVKILTRKLSYDYRMEKDVAVWLLVHLRLTLPRDMVEETVSRIAIPSRFNRVFLQWPIPGENLNVLELPTFNYWHPEFSYHTSLPSEKGRRRLIC